jgi:hypothetical protein
MTTRTSSSLKQAFKRFVELVKDIDDVRCVVAFDDQEPDIFTYIEDLDELVMSRVHEVEIRIMEEFTLLLADFHVRYLEGLPLESFVHPLPALSYLRHGTDGARAKADN